MMLNIQRYREGGNKKVYALGTTLQTRVCPSSPVVARRSSYPGRGFHTTELTSYTSCADGKEAISLCWGGEVFGLEESVSSEDLGSWKNGIEKTE